MEEILAMRFGPASRLIKLVILLRSRRAGITLSEVQEELDISRRTAERLKNTVEDLGWHLEQVPTDLPEKHWRLPPAYGNELLNPSDTELAVLNSAVEILKRDNRVADAEILKGLGEKVLALSKSATRRRLEPDLDILMEAEGIATRVGPRPQVSNHTLLKIREAIKSCVHIEIIYQSRKTGNISKHVICPYGLLFGTRHYLIGYSLNPNILDYRLYSLADIHSIELTENYFERRPNFSLKEYLENSFGIFQEEPFDVVWRFSLEASSDAREYLFHDSQEFEEQGDGSLILKFRAGGWREMCWHLFTWGNEVEVVEPTWLKEKYQKMREII